MNRMSVEELRLVVEWDEGSGVVTVGCGLEPRESRWSVVEAVREAVVQGLGWVEDLAMMERRVTGEGCFAALSGAQGVVVWRARMERPEVVAQTVVRGLGEAGAPEIPGSGS